MGSINYKTSDYITIGVNLNNNYSPEDINNLYDAVENIIDSYDLYYFNVSINLGYYEGFSIDIYDPDYKYYESEMEKEDYIYYFKQVWDICDDLLELGLVVCFPGWCTGYLDFEYSKKTLANTFNQVLLHIQNIKVMED